MKKLRKTTLVLVLLLALALGFIIKLVFVGYQYSGIVQTMADIEELDTVGFQKVLGTKQLEVGPVEYHVRKGYAGRGYIDIVLRFRTNKAEFIEMILCGLPYEQVIEDVWWHGRQDSLDGDVEEIQNIDATKTALLRLKQSIAYYFPKKHLVIDGEDLYGRRSLEPYGRLTTLQAIFDVESGTAIILIQSSLK